MNQPIYLPSLSIVIPVYNGGENFRRCLQSLHKFAPSSVEIIVVADGDTDGSRNIVTEFGYQLLVNENSKGPAFARNKGAQVATGDLLFFLDADVTINENTIPRIIDFFASNPEIEAMIGSYDDSPFSPNFLSQYKNLFHHYTHQQSSETASTFWGACGVIRRHIFGEIGGFNEDYRLPSVEDIELGYRLKEADYSIALCKNIQVQHLKEWRLISLLKAEIFQRAIPWTILLLKYDRIINDLNLGWISRISIISVYALLLFSVMSFWWSYGLMIVLFTVIMLLVLNFKVYQFFAHKKSLIFSLFVIPWHWLYYFYGGLGFVIGLIINKWRKLVTIS